MSRERETKREGPPTCARERPRQSCRPGSKAISSCKAASKPYGVWIGKPNKLMLRAKMNGADPETLVASEKWLAIYTDDFIWSLYRRYKDDPMVKWKDSIKQVVGIESPEKVGMDM